MFSVIMYYKDTEGKYHRVQLNKNLGLFVACDYADIYKKRNKNATFEVINEENNDAEYNV